MYYFKETERSLIETEKPMQDGLGNWYRMHRYACKGTYEDSRMERLTPQQAKAILEINPTSTEKRKQ